MTLKNIQSLAVNSFAQTSKIHHELANQQVSLTSKLGDWYSQEGFQPLKCPSDHILDDASTYENITQKHANGLASCMMKKKKAHGPVTRL